jgi:hypothetical protein
MVSARRVACTGRMLPLAALLAVLPLVGGPAQAASAQSMAVPAYFYPGSLWTQMDPGHPAQPV